MNPLTNTTEPGDGVNAAIAAGAQLAGPQQIGDSAHYAVQAAPGATVKVIDLAELDTPYLPRPRRKTGTFHVHAAAAFVDYLGKHGLPETEVWADEKHHLLQAVINAHQAADEQDDATRADRKAGHSDHRVRLELLTTDSWSAWAGLDRKWLPQVDFANHLEDNAIDILDPAPADMLEIAQSFQATTAADFKSAQRLSSGEVQLRFEETTTARAGQAGEVDIPAVFRVNLQPFVGSGFYEVEARFRYRISSGNLSLSYHLVRPGDVLAGAFRDYVNAVDEDIAWTVFFGRPA